MIRLKQLKLTNCKKMIQSFFKANKFCFLLPVWEVKSWKKCETLWHFGGWERGNVGSYIFLYFGWKNNLLYILWKENKRTVIITAASLNAIESLMILFYFNFTFLRQFRSGCLPGSLPVYRYGDSGGDPSLPGSSGPDSHLPSFWCRSGRVWSCGQK